ncbi:MAG: GAF domain-containing protein [Rhizobacter sp.]|nr:GAF domain-containing protein [Rhizobacter sp.]
MKEFLALLDQLTLQLDAQTTTLNETSVAVSRFIQAQMACSRACVWQLQGDAHEPVLGRLAGFDGEAGAAMTQPLFFRDSGFATYFDRITQHGVYASDDALADEHLAPLRDDYLLPNDIRSALYATIGANGSVWALLCCSQTGTLRRWTPQDVRRIKAYADAISVRRARRRRREAEAASLAERLVQAQSLPTTEPGLL